MTSTALQTSLEHPSIELAGVKIYAVRDGEYVSGRVEFPYTVYGRDRIIIEYQSARPTEPRHHQTNVSENKARQRLDLVNEWQRRCQNRGKLTRLHVAQLVCMDAKIDCSPRSLQMWAKKFREEGESGLIENYTPAPRKQLKLAGELASQAVQIAAWWAFRIGNIDAIDSKVMHVAAALLGRATMPSILSTIDRYYSWPCDRRKMPFKSLSRWAKYDFDKWLLRAADMQGRDGDGAVVVDPAYMDGNFQHPHEEFTARPVPLLDPVRRLPDSIESSLPPSTKTRARDARDRGVRQAIECGSKPLRDDPVVAILAPLDDAYRNMLIRASFKDADARAQAVATLPIWWPLVALPDAARERIDRVTNIPLSERRKGDEPKIARAKVQMFLSELRSARKGRSL